MKQRDKDPVYGRIISYMKPYTLYLTGAFISAVLSVAASLSAPVLIGKGIDYIVGKGQVDFTGIYHIIKYLVIIIFIGFLFQWLMTWCTNQVTYRTVQDLRKELFHKFNRVPLKYIDGHSHGDLIARVVTDIEQISDGLLQGFAQLFTGIITIFGTLCFMLSINWMIALVVVFLTPLSLFVASYIAKHCFLMFKEQSATRGEMTGYVEEMIGNQKIVKTFGHEKEAQEGFEEINKRLYDCGWKAQFYSALTNPCTRFVNNVVYAAVGIIGAIAALSGRLTIGQLTTFLAYANQYTKPFNEISGVVNELQNAFASARRVFAVLDEPEEVIEKEEEEASVKQGRVDINHVDFSYEKEKQLITDLNLHVKPGQRVAIVGPTGCGKTTIINLLMRFYDVNSGSIEVDGIDIRQMKRKDLRDSYGMVLQETWLFAGTVRDNIAYGRSNASEEEIIEAAKAAHAHGFIKRLPHGYDTIISEDGDNVSQGQKQLLCIARVMLTKPPMLILDEATSNIDTRTEIKIQKAFANMMEGRTSFIVAHRLSTIKEADIILVMNQGKIIEQGKHEELLAKNGFYANLYNSQFAVS